MKGPKVTVTIGRDTVREMLEGYVSATMAGPHVLEAFTVHRNGGIELVIRTGEGEPEAQQPELPGSTVLE